MHIDIQTMNALETRDATPGDFDAFLRLAPELGVDDPAPSLERWTDLILPTMMVAERAGEVVGYTYHRILEGVAHLYNIVSAPSARRTGVGRALMSRVIERSRASGARELYLNVKPDNRAAIALYESFGLEAYARSWALRMPWEAVLRAPAPYLDEVRPSTADEDRAVEQNHGFPAGMIANHRRAPGYVLRTIPPGTFAAFDPGFPGAYPFLADSLEHAMSLLHALHAFAKPGQEHINLMLADQPDLKDALLAAGATLKLTALRMRGPL